LPFTFATATVRIIAATSASMVASLGEKPSPDGAAGGNHDVDDVLNYLLGARAHVPSEEFCDFVKREGVPELRREGRAKAVQILD
jgi:hypothetical protein